MSNIQIFDNTQFGQVRTIREGDTALFCGADIASSLGYKDTVNALKQHCRGVVKHHITDALGRNQEASFITEGDVYRLVVRSNLPAAEKFERWIFEEVLPTIRKTGGYVANDELFLATYLPNADEATAALFKSTLATVRSLNARIEADKPKVLFASAVEASHTSILVGELAKLLRQNGVEIGQNRLFAWMRDNGYLIKRCGTDYNMPTQYSMERGLFEIKETVINNPNGSISISKTPKVTGKGQTYFVNLFLGME